MSELPRGWVEARLGDILGPRSDKVDPSTVPGLPFLGLEDVEPYSGRVIDYGSTAEMKSAVALFSKGDLLFGRLRPYLQKILIAERDGAASAEFIVLKPNLHCDLRYFSFLLRSDKFLEHTTMVSSGDRPRVSYDSIGDFRLSLPPLVEQKRIVVKVDALHAKSARARTELARIETLVSCYKQAVLSKGFSGELTAAEDAEANSGRGLGCPSHWRQMHLGEIADIKSGITLGKKRKPDEQLLDLPYLRVANVQRGWLDLREIKTVEVTAREAEALFLREGDVLMNEGGDRDKLGRGWVWDGQIADCIHQNHVFRVRLAPGTVPSRFLSYYANEFGQKHFFDEGKQTTNLASISKAKLSAMKVPVPPFEEAKEIVRRIEAAFAKIDRLAAEARRALELLGKLDESILAKAFRGELVPQDENDEPAEHLLARIRAEREKAPKASAGGERRHDGL